MRPGGLEFSEPQMITPRRAWLIAARGSAHMIQRAGRRLGSPRRGCLGEVELPQRSAILIFRCRTIAPAPPPLLRSKGGFKALPPKANSCKTH